jgi:hypothetical protein
MRVIKAYICQEKYYVLTDLQFYSFKSAKTNWALKIAKSQIEKIYGPQIANPQLATFAEGPQI